MLSLQTGMHWAASPQPVEELLTQTFMYGQQNPSMHWSPERHLPQVPTDFLGVQSDSDLISDVSSRGSFGSGKTTVGCFGPFAEFSSSSLSERNTFMILCVLRLFRTSISW